MRLNVYIIYCTSYIQYHPILLHLIVPKIGTTCTNRLDIKVLYFIMPVTDHTQHKHTNSYVLLLLKSS